MLGKWRRDGVWGAEKDGVMGSLDAGIFGEMGKSGMVGGGWGAGVFGEGWGFLGCRGVVLVCCGQAFEVFWGAGRYGGVG